MNRRERRLKKVAHLRVLASIEAAKVKKEAPKMEDFFSTYYAKKTAGLRRSTGMCCGFYEFMGVRQAHQ